MLLEKIRKKLQRKQQGKIAKRLLPISWWKLVAGLVLLSIGVFFGYMYLENARLMFFGMGAVVFIAPSLFLLYQSFKSGEGGFAFKRRYTGRENAIVLMAGRNGQGTKDVPVAIKFLELKPRQAPESARLHYLRNLKKHFYELCYNTVTHRLEPVVMPDKKSFPPGLFQIPAAMQIYKDAIEYSPPTLMQKIAPGIILLAMGIVGILMVVTAG